MYLQILTQFIILSTVPLDKYSLAEISTRNIKSTSSGEGDDESISLLETKLTEKIDNLGRIILSWELGDNKSRITFELWAQTLGYVGFGISPNGGMAGADIFIAGVSPDGTPYSSDRFASANEEPKIDSHRDWTFLEAKETENTTYIKFSRLLDTCDTKEDYPISKGTNRVIWAIGATDEFVKHSMENRGTRSISFLHKRPKLNTTGLKTWTVKLEGLEMPSDETSYWCTFHKSFPLESPKYLVAYDAHLPDANAIKHIHHMVIFKCYFPEDGSLDKTLESLTTENNGSRGYELSEIQQKWPPIYEDCHSLQLVGFAKGSQLTALPNNVAYKIEKQAGKKMYLLFEAHLDNPQLSKGVRLSYGMKLYYTDEPREYTASAYDVSYAMKGILIPPNSRNFVFRGQCSSDCTEKLDPNGIAIFHVMLHAHRAGKKLKFRHFRNEIELPWIAQDDNFDFNYQQFRLLDEERKVLPGDRLTIECEYDSTVNEGKIVVGGTSSSEEMCQAIFWYYPSNPNFVRCWSRPDVEQTLAPFNISKYTDTPGTKVLSSIIIEEPINLRGPLVDSLNYKFNWSDDFNKQFQLRKLTEDQIVGCGPETDGKPEDKAWSLPKTIIQFVPKETCS